MSSVNNERTTKVRMSANSSLPDLWRQLCSNTTPLDAKENATAKPTGEPVAAEKDATATPASLTVDHLALWSRNISLQQASLLEAMRKSQHILQEQMKSANELRQLLGSLERKQQRLENAATKDERELRLLVEEVKNLTARLEHLEQDLKSCRESTEQPVLTLLQAVAAQQEQQTASFTTMTSQILDIQARHTEQLRQLSIAAGVEAITAANEDPRAEAPAGLPVAPQPQRRTLIFDEDSQDLQLDAFEGWT